VADFCERTWALPHYPLHLVVDEADEFAPQRFGALPQQQRRSLDLLGRMVMRGRARGMGGTLISLRPAVLSKNLLSQVDELYLLRLSEPHDITAARSWLEDFEHQVTEQQKISCLSQLPVLPTGTAYFLRGGDRPMFRRFKVREKRTHDSSRALGTGTASRPVLSSPAPAVLEAARKIFAASSPKGEQEDGDAGS
jgi:DNA helicase HerA-like ATPase